MRRVGLMGCGNIAELLAGLELAGEVTAVFDRHADRAQSIAQHFCAKAFTEFEAFGAEPLDLVIEIASVSAVGQYGLSVLERSCDLMVLSAGALADEALLETLRSTAAANGVNMYLPSGALFGLDNAKVARFGGVERLSVRSTKPPASFGIEADERLCLFKGSARECIARFAANANAAVALGIAAKKEVQVELWADPSVSTNMHEILINGEFGEAVLKIDNRISPRKPSTSYLAALSVAAMLETLDDPVVVGT